MRGGDGSAIMCCRFRAAEKEGGRIDAGGGSLGRLGRPSSPQSSQSIQWARPVSRGPISADGTRPRGSILFSFLSTPAVATRNRPDCARVAHGSGTHTPAPRSSTIAIFPPFEEGTKRTALRDSTLLRRPPLLSYILGSCVSVQLTSPLCDEAAVCAVQAAGEILVALSFRSMPRKAFSRALR